MGWNGHRIRVSIDNYLLKRKNLPPLLPGLELATFRSRVQHSTKKLSRLLGIIRLAVNSVSQLVFLEESDPYFSGKKIIMVQYKTYKIHLFMNVVECCELNKCWSLLLLFG